MSRFPSFNHVPSETRRVLRDRFASKLRVVRQGRFLKRLLADLKVSSNADWPTAEVAYATAGPTGSEPPNLQALVNLKWLRRIWGRAAIGLDLRLSARRAAPGAMDAFKVLLSGIHGHHYEAGVTVLSDPELVSLFDAVTAGRGDRAQIVSRSPEWIAARLWEMTLAQEPTPASALRRWLDLWALLQYPSLVPGAVWSAADATAFREAAIGVIATEPGLRGWIETRDLYAQQAALAHNIPVAVANSQFPQPPDTLVDRALSDGVPADRAQGLRFT